LAGRPDRALIRLPLAALVSVLGVTQIVAWGTLFYSISVLGEPMRQALGVGEVLLFGSFTLGALVSGALAPAIGRDIDRHGGRRVLVAGALAGAGAMALLAGAQNAAMLVAGWLLAGAAGAATLYDPAFATLHQVAGARYRAALTALTLFGGFASTVFWPLAHYLLEVRGWRVAYSVFALLLVACAGVHALVVPTTHRDGAVRAPAAPPPPPASTRRALRWLALSFAAMSFLGAALAAHLIGLLTVTGLSARDAVLIGSLIGPMQVAGRIAEFSVGRHAAPRHVGTLACALMVIAMAVLTQVHGVWIVALAFVIPYGWANGVFTIVRGTLPAALFGHAGYGARLGWLARPQFIARALAPVLLAAGFAADPTRALTLVALFGVALVAAAAYALALRAARPVS
jgi:predicted MFS family arabinose efflux permease